MTHVAHSAAANAAVVATHSTAAKVKPASATTATHGLATTATHGLATTATAAAGLNSGLRPLFRQGKLLDIAGTVGSFGFQHIVHPRLHRLCKFTIR
jgi:hypothetical protein